MAENQPNRPSHIIYHVKDTNTLDDKGRRRGIWTRVGSVWPARSGNGSQIILDYHSAAKGHMYMIPWPAREEGKEDDLSYEPEPEELTAADIPF